MITFERGNPYGQQNVFVASKTHATSTSIILQNIFIKACTQEVKKFFYLSMEIVFWTKRILSLLQYIQKII